LQREHSESFVESVRRALSRDAQPEPVPTPSTNQWLPFGGVDDDNEDPQHPWCEHSLTYTHRLMGWAFCLIAGAFCSFLSSSSIPSIVTGHPLPFAAFFTLGNILSLLSTTFLVGVRSQMTSMFHAKRWTASLIYIGSIFLTLFCALHLQLAWATILSLCLQTLAFIWYSLSYVPFGRDAAVWCMEGCMACKCFRFV